MFSLTDFDQPILIQFGVHIGNASASASRRLLAFPTGVEDWVVLELTLVQRLEYFRSINLLRHGHLHPVLTIKSAWVAILRLVLLSHRGRNRFPRIVWFSDLSGLNWGCLWFARDTKLHPQRILIV